jgi:methionyl-tRNA formyltransferase
MRVLLIGEGAAGTQVLRGLLNHGHDVVAVMTDSIEPSEAVSLGHVAKGAGLRVWAAERVEDPDLSDLLLWEEVDMLLNVYSLHIVHDRILQVPRIGSFNLHPSPLPAYAGLNSVCWALFRGERSHGVTVHWMAPRIDSGPIAYQEIFPIEPEETGLSLATKCIRVGVRLVARLVDTAVSHTDRIPAIPQDLTERSYFGRDTPYEGPLSWSMPAHAFVNFVRACNFHPLRSPWGTATAVVGDRTFGLRDAQLTGSPARAPAGSYRPGKEGSVLVACADEWVRLPQLIDGGRPVSAFAAVYQSAESGGR